MITGQWNPHKNPKDNRGFTSVTEIIADIADRAFGGYCDFNDDPKNESIKKILNAKRDRDKVKKRDLYNPYEKMHGKGVGTLAYRDNWNLFDQIIFSGSYLDNTFKEFSFYKSLIYNKKYLFNQSGRFKGYPFRSFAGGSYLDGYSDHLPVYILLIKEL